jgi:hypothetical protein
LVAGRYNKAELKLADRKTRRNWKESGGIGVCIKGVVNYVPIHALLDHAYL